MIGASVKFANPSSAGCVNGTRSSAGSGNDCVCVAVGECSNARVVCKVIIRRPV